MLKKLIQNLNLLFIINFLIPFFMSDGVNKKENDIYLVDMVYSWIKFH
jgi:hypothetical protein